MRILLLSVTSPFPPNNGVKMRSWAILQALADEGHEIDLVTFQDANQPAETSDELARVCRQVIWIPHKLKSVSSSRDYFGRLQHLFASTPYGTQSTKSQAMAGKISSLLSEGSIDLVLSEQTDLLVNLPDSLPVPLVVDFHNVDYLIFERYLQFEKNPAKKLYAYLESRKVRAWERIACQRSAAAMACSDHDRALLQKLHPAAPILAIPNVVDVESYVPQDAEDAQKILFQGGMDWYPNRDAVDFFASEIYPLIRKEMPDVRFVVAGRNPPEDFRERLSRVPGIEFTGTVPDMRKVVADAAVCVIPLRMGSGTRLKILEGGAMAKPMVSTRLGAEGLDFVQGQEIMLEDEPAAFAGSVVRLLRDSSLRKTLGAGARRRVEMDYSYGALRTAVRNLLRQLPSRRSSILENVSSG